MADKNKPKVDPLRQRAIDRLKKNKKGVNVTFNSSGTEVFTVNGKPATEAQSRAFSDQIKRWMRGMQTDSVVDAINGG